MTRSVLLSGYATSVANMPDWLQLVTQTNPVTHFIVICKGVFLKDLPASDIWAHTWPMIAIAIATLSIGMWLFNRRLEWWRPGSVGQGANTRPIIV